MYLITISLKNYKPKVKIEDNTYFLNNYYKLKHLLRKRVLITLDESRGSIKKRIHEQEIT
jgi:hypothetical protein